MGILLQSVTGIVPTERIWNVARMSEKEIAPWAGIELKDNGSSGEVKPCTIGGK